LPLCGDRRGASDDPKWSSGRVLSGHDDVIVFPPHHGDVAIDDDRSHFSADVVDCLADLKSVRLRCGDDGVRVHSQPPLFSNVSCCKTILKIEQLTNAAKR